MCALLSLHGAFEDGLKKRVVHGYKKCGGQGGLQMREVQVTCTPRPLRKRAVPKIESGLSARKPSEWVGPSSVLVGADPTRPTHSCFKH